MEKVRAVVAGRGLELWLCGMALASSTYTAATFGQFEEYEHAGEMVGTFGVLIIVTAIFARARGLTTLGEDPRPKPLFIWFLPAAVTITMLPVIMAGGLDPEMGVFLSLFLFLLLAYLCLAVALLVALLVVWPLELLGRGLLRVVTGKPDGGPLVLWGSAGVLFSLFCVLPVLALDDLPSGRGAAWAVFEAVLGIEGGYAVTSPTMLWTARAAAVALAAVILAVARQGRSPEEVAAPGRTAR
ncbi:hypothetical protein ACFV4N_10075 [Actinosynnema sp. NPDC059797]